jgi:hypothetical protein
MRYAHHMARQRRGGFRPPELRGTLGTLLRTAVPAVRDVLERGAREGRARLGDALSGRRRTDALAELGEIVLDLIRRGEIDPAELPEVQDVVAHLDELDAEAEEAPPVPRTLSRKRFDDRPAVAAPPTERGRKRGKPAPPDDDDTVSARTWSPPKRKSPETRVWRPAATDRPADEITERERPTPNPAKKGGISFDDEDLAEYMHPDDVPPKDNES